MLLFLNKHYFSRIPKLITLLRKPSADNDLEPDECVPYLRIPVVYNPKYAPGSTTFSGTRRWTTQIVKLCTEKYGWTPLQTQERMLRIFSLQGSSFVRSFSRPTSYQIFIFADHAEVFEGFRMRAYRILKRGETFGADRPFCVARQWTLQPDTFIAPAAVKDSPDTYPHVCLPNWSAAIRTLQG